MITPNEIRRRARDLGVSESYLRRDYVLNHILAVISETLPELCFRGGTALARVYWPDFRLSEDLDFIADDDPPDLHRRLQNAVDLAHERTRWELSLVVGKTRRGWCRSAVSSEAGDLIVDVNIGERAYLEPTSMGLLLPYSDLAEPSRVIRTLALPEILGNKWYMLGDTDRREPRDLYDLWAGLTRFSVPFDDVAVGHTAKYGYPPQVSSLETTKRLEALWDQRLAHQIGHLPPFEEAYDAVARAFGRWQAEVDKPSAH